MGNEKFIFFLLFQVTDWNKKSPRWWNFYYHNLLSATPFGANQWTHGAVEGTASELSPSSPCIAASPVIYLSIKLLWSTLRRQQHFIAALWSLRRQGHSIGHMVGQLPFSKRILQVKVRRKINELLNKSQGSQWQERDDESRLFIKINKCVNYCNDGVQDYEIKMCMCTLGFIHIIAIVQYLARVFKRNKSLKE